MSRKPDGKKRSVQSDTFERLEQYWKQDVGEFLDKLTEKPYRRILFRQSVSEKPREI